jgi:TonB family protein
MEKLLQSISIFPLTFQLSKYLMRKIPFALLILVSSQCCAQSSPDSIKTDTMKVDSLNMDEVDNHVFYESEASFPGDEKALKAYLLKNLVTPAEVTEKKLMGSVIVSFVVRSTGKITNVSIKKSFVNCPSCDAEALRLIQNMPEWVPALAYGKYVATSVELPVRFKP